MGYFPGPGQLKSVIETPGLAPLRHEFVGPEGEGFREMKGSSAVFYRTLMGFLVALLLPSVGSFADRATYIAPYVRIKARRRSKSAQSGAPAAASLWVPDTR